ncbi:Uncharacterised protein [Rodentibacter pneumotropicus]|uniref:Uncharacterized protein n=1 Tax=Rodentibacter pneumotropicus TaxID=758 RepID=A0A3S4VG86_9PAST|nr:Uncharacterised protein [Rodentibacter pneumotropicus]
MIDIQGELLRIRQQREQEYISVVELLDFLKSIVQIHHILKLRPIC